MKYASSYERQVMQLIAEVEEQRHHVVVDSYSATWSELMAQYAAADIEIDPAYQRAFRWDVEQQTKYLESLLLNIPTPPIFLAEKQTGAFEVIDGLQRFSTVIKFFAAEVFQGEDKFNNSISARISKPTINDIRVPSILSDAPILTGLEGLSRENMPETLVRTLRYSRVHIILLKKESSKLARYNVFTRLNRSGTTLSNQEIRNCSARLFDVDFPNKLMAMADLSSVETALGLSSKETSSMGAQESILRLLSFGHFSPQTKSIEEFLDSVMYQVSSNEFRFTKRIENNLLTTFDLISKAFPNGEAFKFYRGGKFSGGFSTNLFDIIGCGVYKNISKVKKKTPTQLKAHIIALHKQEEAMKLTGAGSNTKAKMLGRVEFGEKWFA
jgi:hypothetical protein